MTTLDLHAGIDKYAVYEGATDAPLTNPLANLPSLKWHSDLKYVGVVSTITGSVNLNITSSGWTNVGGLEYEYTIASHGQSYAPMLTGTINLDGVNVPVNGTFFSGFPVNGGAEQFSFYATQTAIKLRRSPAYATGPFADYVRSYTIHVLNVGLDTSNNFVFPPYNVGFEATTTRMKCGYFDTNYKYLYKNAAGSLGFIQGPTLSYGLGAPVYTSGGTFGALCLIFAYGSLEERGLAYPSQPLGFTPSAIKADIR